MIPLPSYIDPDAWDGFVEMRRKIKAPLTTRAATLILYELQRIKDAGHDPNAALDQSTMKCWRDVWPVREKDIPRQAQSEDVAARLRADDANRQPPRPEDVAKVKAVVANLAGRMRA